MFVRLSALLGCCVASVSLAGCSGEDNGVLVPVSGTVTYKGSPLTKGEINFIPRSGRGLRGTIGEDGRFTPSSYGVDDGAHPGKYKVTVISRGDDLPIPKKKKGQMMEEDMQGTGKLFLVSKYKQMMTSKLAAEVVAGGSIDIKFDLKD